MLRQDKEPTAAPAGHSRFTGRTVSLLFLGLVLGALMVSPAPAGRVATVTRIPTITLRNGVEFPLIASSTADLTAEQTDIALRVAALAGVKNVDFDGTDETSGVAKAIAAMGRDAFFLATRISKPPPDMKDPAAAKALAQQQFDDKMAVLGIDVLDTLLLTDSPSCEVMQAQWEAVEDMCAAARRGNRTQTGSGPDLRACDGRALNVTGLTLAKAGPLPRDARRPVPSQLRQGPREVDRRVQPLQKGACVRPRDGQSHADDPLYHGERLERRNV